MKGKILVVYHHNRGYPLNATTKDLLYSFGKYAPGLCYYVNAAFGVPKYLKDINFDLIIFDPLFTYKRSRPHRFKKIIERCQLLKKIKSRKVVIMQDEHIQSKEMDEFINVFKINRIFSVTESTQWSKLYRNIRNEVSFTKVLTGYLDTDTGNHIQSLAKNMKTRPIDIGYRCSQARYWLGEHGYLKNKVGEAAEKHASKFSLVTDISMKPKDTLLGDDWYKFLLKCKYTLGAESGASLADRDGLIEYRTLEYLLAHPGASFEETKQACCEQEDGNIKIAALAPRHLEACATRTCQLLVEGEYNGILKPMQHYIPIKKDFSNIEEVLKMAKEDKLRREIVENAYRDIVASGKYTYRSFVDTVLTKSMGENHEWSEVTPEEYAGYQQAKKREHRLWKLIPVTSFAINTFISKLPKSWFLKLIKSSN